MITRKIYLREDQRLYSAEQVAPAIELIIDLRGHLKGVHHGGRINQEDEKHTLGRVDAVLTMLAGE